MCAPDENSGAPGTAFASGPNTCGPASDGNRYRLATQVYACRTDGGVVFLDASRDRYYGLGGTEIARLLDWVVDCQNLDRGVEGGSDTPIVAERLERLANMLMRQGLLCLSKDSRDNATSGRASSDARLQLHAPQLDPPELAAVNARPTRPRDMLNFLLACARAAWSLRRSSLGTIAARVTGARCAEESSELGPTIQLTRVFQKLRRWLFSGKDRCLFNSLALVYFLQYYHQFPYLVIGVKTSPFAAHAWVQKDRVVLDGNPASIGHFTPLLVA